MATTLSLHSNVTTSVPHKAKLRRRGLPKSSSGCRTCRTRRVKCGEEKPSCLRCIKFGTTCQWDPKKMAQRPAKPVQLLPKIADTGPEHLLSRSQRKEFLPKINLVAPLLRDLSKSPFNDDTERRYFDVFSTKTAFDLLHSFDFGTLRQILLQACVSDPSIRHAVIALGALDRTAESFEAFRSSPDDTETRDYAVQHHQNALKQYMIAIKHMRSAAANNKQDLRTMLLTCVVIFCFEAWDGREDDAIKQVQTGLRLIWNWRKQRANRQLLEAPFQSTAIEEDVIRAFTRLHIQVVSFVSAEHSNESQEPVMTQEPATLDQIPQVFSSLRDAEICQSAIVGREAHFMAFQVPLPKQRPPLVMIPLSGWYGVTSSHVVASQQSILAAFLKWQVAFDPLWKRLKARNDPNVGVAAVLKLHVTSFTQAMLQVCMENEGKWDDYQDLFTQIVELSEFVLNVSNTAKSNTPKFKFEGNVILPLMLVGHKCRDRYIRRRAISMLLCNPRREGVWDSSMTGKCAEWAMEVEETYLEHGKVPVWARIHGVIIQRGEIPRRAKLTCEQRVSPISEELITLRTTISW